MKFLCSSLYAEIRVFSELTIGGTEEVQRGPVRPGSPYLADWDASGSGLPQGMLLSGTLAASSEPWPTARCQKVWPNST